MTTRLTTEVSTDFEVQLCLPFLSYIHTVYLPQQYGKICSTDYVAM